MSEETYDPKDFLIHAVDVETTRELLERLFAVGRHLTWIKLGMKTLRNVPHALDLTRDEGLWEGNIMLDWKPHDVPRIASGACKADAARGVQMMTTHCSNGPDALKRIVEEVGEVNPETLVLGVTVLTSFEEAVWQEMMGTTRTIQDQVLWFVDMGVKAGLKGFVCSAEEAPEVKKRFPHVKLVTPGIRLPESDNDDQARVKTPLAAIADGSDYLVGGSEFAKAIRKGTFFDLLDLYFMFMRDGYAKRSL